MTTTEVTATEAARRFSEILDAIEHRGEQFTIVRRGRPIARLAPAHRASGAEVKALLRRHPPDPGFAEAVREVRSLLVLDERW